MVFHGKNMTGDGSGQRLAVGRRRSNIEIIADILRVGENGAGKTEIMYSANMSYTQIQRYLNFLMGHGFIKKLDFGGPVVTYQLTDSGTKLLKTINALTDMLGQTEEEKP